MRTDFREDAAKTPARPDLTKNRKLIRGRLTGLGVTSPAGGRCRLIVAGDTRIL
jgi:hypothetical protein